MQIVELSGLSCPTVRSAIDRYEEGGLAALKPGTRGKRAGQGRTLTEPQEQAIRQVICDQRPDQLTMDPEGPLNADLKHAIGTKAPVRTRAKLKLATTEHTAKLKPSPARVKSFFQDPRVKYAA